MRHGRFTSVVVPLDDGVSSERATIVARSLARRGGLDVEVVEVLPPGTDVGRAGDDLRHRAQLRQLPSCHAHVLLGYDAPAVLAEHIRTHPGTLVVIATGARGPVGELLESSTAAALMAEIDAPVVVVGPHVGADWAAGDASLVLCSSPLRPLAPAAADAVATWQETFAPPPLRLVQVAPPVSSTDPDLDEALLRRADLAALAERGVASSFETLHAEDGVGAIIRHAGSVGVLAATSARWRAPTRTHAGSWARHLTRRAATPVLVVPDRYRVTTDR